MCDYDSRWEEGPEPIYEGPITKEEFELDIALRLNERHNVAGFGAFGPLTRDQTEAVAAYEAHCDAELAEYEAQRAAGGREICPNCGQRSVKTRTVCTLGYPGHPGADYSALRECEKCDYRDLG